MTDRPHGLIYRVTNKVNGKSYIGQTTLTLAQRWACHVTNRERAPLACAIRKYGREAFSVDEMEQCGDRDALDAAERRWIATLNTRVPAGYNLTDGGNSGTKHDASTRAKQSALLRKRYFDPTAREEHAEQMRGIWTAAVREKASASHKARCADPAERERLISIAKARWSKPGAREAESIAAMARWSPERREAFSEAVKASWDDPERRAARLATIAKPDARKPVIVTKNGVEQEFASARDAARALKLNETSISLCLHGKRTHVGGYTFRRK